MTTKKTSKPAKRMKSRGKIKDLEPKDAKQVKGGTDGTITNRLPGKTTYQW